MSNYAVTKSGTKLPLLDMRGKPYLQVAHRLVWLNEEAARFDITSTILKADKDESIVQAKVNVYEQDGKLIRSANATKREDSKGFADHLEKAETGAIGRALALLGFGTQFTTQDLDEGTRLADSPILPAVAARAPVKLVAANATPAPVEATATVVNVAPTSVSIDGVTTTTAPAPVEKPARSSFRKPSAAKATAATEGADNGWS
jgi:hypothetical protein